MKKIFLLLFCATCLTSCFIESGGSSKDQQIEALEQELDSVKANPTIVRDTIKVREQVKGSTELTDQAKQLLNDIAE